MASNSTSTLYHNRKLFSILQQKGIKLKNTRIYRTSWVLFLLSLDGKKPLMVNVVLGSAKQDEGRSFCWDGIKYMVVLFLHWSHETGRCIVSDNWTESKLDHTLTECFPSHMLFVHVSTRHWSCSAKCILKHQKKLNFTTANSVRKRNQRI